MLFHHVLIVCRIERNGIDIDIHSHGSEQVDMQIFHVGDIDCAVVFIHLQAYIIEFGEFVSVVASTGFNRADSRLVPRAHIERRSHRCVCVAEHTLHVGGVVLRSRSGRHYNRHDRRGIGHVGYVEVLDRVGILAGGGGEFAGLGSHGEAVAEFHGDVGR